MHRTHIDDAPDHRSGNAGAATSGRVMHSPRVYDALGFLMTLGREKQMRLATLEAAGVAPGQSVLDVGCGTGTLTLAARAAVGPGGRVSGIDPSREMIAFARTKAARARCDIDVRVGAVEALPFPDGTFDLVLSSLMLHHLPDDVKRTGAAEIARVLKPGGHFFAVDFGAGSPGSLHSFIGKLFGHATGHTSRAQLESAKQMLAAAGLEDIASGRLASTPLVFLRGRRGGERTAGPEPRVAIPGTAADAGSGEPPR